MSLGLDRTGITAVLLPTEVILNILEAALEIAIEEDASASRVAVGRPVPLTRYLLPCIDRTWSIYLQLAWKFASVSKELREPIKLISQKRVDMLGAEKLALADAIRAHRGDSAQCPDDRPLPLLRYPAWGCRQCSKCYELRNRQGNSSKIRIINSQTSSIVDYMAG